MTFRSWVRTISLNILISICNLRLTIISKKQKWKIQVMMFWKRKKLSLQSSKVDQRYQFHCLLHFFFVSAQNNSFFNQGSPPQAEWMIRSAGERKTYSPVCPLIKRYYSITIRIYRIKHQLQKKFKKHNCQYIIISLDFRVLTCTQI